MDEVEQQLNAVDEDAAFFIGQSAHDAVEGGGGGRDGLTRARELLAARRPPSNNPDVNAAVATETQFIFGLLDHHALPARQRPAH